MSQPAQWQIFDEADALWLQIELGADYGVTLTIRDGDPPAVRLWRGRGEMTFDGQTHASFRAWLDQMAFEQE